MPVKRYVARHRENRLRQSRIIRSDYSRRNFRRRTFNACLWKASLPLYRRSWDPGLERSEAPRGASRIGSKRTSGMAGRGFLPLTSDFMAHPGRARRAPRGARYTGPP